jgi:hypothetical protein
MSIAVVQAVAKNTLSSTITAPAAGNDLIVCINSFNTTTATITSVKLGTVSLTQALTKNQGGDGATQSWLYYLANVAAGQTAVAVTGSGLQVDTSNGGVDIIEASGLLTASPLDKAPAGGGGTSTSWSSASTGTLSQPNELVVGTACGFSMANPSGWTMVSGGGTARRTGYKIVSATTAQTFNGTMSLADWSALIASFKGISSGVSSATAAIASML